MIDAAWIAEARKGLEGVTPGEWRTYEHPDKPGEVQVGAGRINGWGDGWDELCVAAVFWGPDDNGREPHADHIVRMSSPVHAAELLRLAEIGLAAEAALAAQTAEVERLRTALEFYADPETYDAISFFPDRPCGEFIEDFGDHSGDYNRPMPGLRARQALRR